jgi:hypothetical protein
MNGKQFIVFRSLSSFPSTAINSYGVEYVRFVDKDGYELLYYDYSEWIEEPRSVMGAIMSAIMNGAKL